MRNLIIKREKSFVGFLSKARVYIQDELAGDTKINGDKCYKLGELKNGDEKSFVIGDEETKIYVIQEKFSRNICNEVCYIPSGTEDIYLMGECKYNPLGGNNFRFHGMSDPRVLANRKKTKRKLAVFFLLCAIIGFILGFIGNYDPPKYAKDGEPYRFVEEAGVAITLTDAFSEMETDGTVFTYGTNDAVVFGYEEKFDSFEGFEDWSEEEYGKELINVWKMEDVELQNENGLYFFEYEGNNENTGETYCYMVVIYKEYDAFWNITFAIGKSDYETYKPMFFEWAKSVEFSEN